MIRALKYRSFLLRTIIVLVPVSSFVFAAVIRFYLAPLFGFDAQPADLQDYLFLLLLVFVFWSIATEHYQVGSMENLIGRTYVRFSGARACVVTYVLVLAVIFFVRSISFSRVFLIVAGTSQLLLTMLIIAVARLLNIKRIESGQRIRILIVGADEFADRTAKQLTELPVLPCSIVGFLRLDGQEVAVKDAPVLDFDQVESVAVGTDIDDIIVALPPDRLAELAYVHKALKSLPIPVRAVLDLGSGVQLEHRISRIGALQVLDLHSSPSESLIYVLLKRAFDLTFATIAVVATAPLMAVIALVIRLSTSGPVLFVQDRVGLSGRIFRMYKFTTMKEGANSESDRRWTVADDPRCTAFGRFLRKTSLDELPQFFNVLKGDMSVVGPRPERPYFVRKFGTELDAYHSRHQLKVGITGWAQVNGLRGDSSIADRLAHDLYYLQNWSLAFDVQIIFLTMFRGLFGKNAY